MLFLPHNISSKEESTQQRGLRSPPQTMHYKVPETTWKEDVAAIWNQAGLRLQRWVCYLEIKIISQTKRLVKVSKNKLFLTVWLKGWICLYSPPAHTEQSCTLLMSMCVLSQIYPPQHILSVDGQNWLPSYPPSLSRGITDQMANHLPLSLLLSVQIAGQEDMHTSANSVLGHWQFSFFNYKIGGISQ